jgi:hypothetical protein
MKTADMVWVATALLHREHPDRPGFAPREIRARAREEGFADALPAGFDTHVSQQTVANRPANPGKYRLLYAEGHGRLRLCRSHDDVAPGRTGKRVPLESDLPERYRPLLGWYWTEYDRRPSPLRVVRESRPLTAGSPAGASSGQEIARRALDQRFGQALSPRAIGDVPRRFDFVSADGSVVGSFQPPSDAPSAQASLAAISQEVWLLEKSGAREPVLVFASDRLVALEWIARFGHLAGAVRFFFLSDDGRLDELSHEPELDAAWGRLSARSFARDWESEEDSVYDALP